ncbi:hypothetical protein BDV12DRAFT_190341 [Aspergillus spectabilis]
MLLYYVILCSLWAGVFGMQPESITLDLGPQLSNLASISVPNISNAGWWGVYGAPQPSVVVLMGNEEEVAMAILSRKRHPIPSLPFLAQSGGHGWAQTFHLGLDGLFISLRRNYWRGRNYLRYSFSSSRETSPLVFTGNCNCMGAALGTGNGNMMGSLGFGVDNILELKVVLEDGQSHTVTPADRNIFWALAGAGVNCGIVTSATMKVYPFSPRSSRVAWYGRLGLYTDKIEAAIREINDDYLQPEMNIFLVLFTTGSPEHTPQLGVTVFYYESEVTGRQVFAPIFNVGVEEEEIAEIPYAQWNDATAGFCTPGGYISGYSAGLNRLDPEAWRLTWEEYAAFALRNGPGNSVIFLKAYAMLATPEMGSCLMRGRTGDCGVGTAMRLS